MTSLDPPRPDEDATAALLAEAGWIRAMAGRLARDQAEADDVAQGTLTLALERTPSARAGLRPWLARVAARVARHRRRAEARRGHREAEAARAGASASAEDLFERVEAQGRLISHVRSLPSPYAEVILRRYYEGQSADEIAAAMGGSAATTRSRLARGLSLLRKGLGESETGSDRRGSKLLALAAGFPGPIFSSSHASTAAALIAMKVSTKTAACIAAFFLLLATGITLTVGSRPGSIEPPPADPVSAPSIDGSDAAALGNDRASPIAGPAADPNRLAMAPVDPASDATQPAADAASPKASIVRARLVNAQGQPVRGALFSSIFKSGKPRGTGNFAAADADGHVTLELADGALRAWRTEVFPMVFSASSHGSATQFVTATPMLHGETGLGEIELLPGGSVRGTIVDSSGRAIPDALIYADVAIIAGDLQAQRVSGPEKEEARPRADADAAGRFECGGVAAGEARLWIHAKGFLWTLTDPITVTAGQALDVGSITLDPVPAEFIIAGTVLSPEGDPVAGATVSFASQSEEGSIKALADGSFTIYPKNRFGMRLVAWTPGGRYGASEMTQVSPGDRPELRLSTRQTIQVTVLDDNGEPLPGALLMTVVPTTSVASPFAGRFWPVPGSDWIKADSHGQATVPALGQAFAVNVSVDRYVLQRVGPFGLSDVPRELTITMEKIPTLSGRVTYLGQPVSNAEVQVTRRIDDFISLERGFPMRLFKSGGRHYNTNEDGQFECPIQGDSGAITLLAVSDGLATAEFDLDLPPGRGTDGIEIKMTEGGTLRGTLLPPPGEDPRKLVVAASRGDGEVKWTRTDAEGQYELTHLAPGPWRVEGRDREPAMEMSSAANSEEEGDFKWNIEIREGETTSFDVDMRQLGDVEIHGRVTLDGVPMEGWIVTVKTPIHATMAQSEPTTATEGDGTFLLIARSGSYRLQLEGEIHAGVQVQLIRNVKLEGQRLDVDVPLVTGVFEDTVPAGTKRIRLVRGNYQRGSSDITVLPVAEDGTVRARVPIGRSSLHTPTRDSAMFDGWHYERMVEVTQ